MIFLWFIARRVPATTNTTINQLELDNNFDYHVVLYKWVLLVIWRERIMTKCLSSLN